MASGETRRPVVSRFLLEYLGIQHGAVTDVLLVYVRFLPETRSIFNVMHIVKSLVTAPISYVINSSDCAQLLVRCSNPYDVDKLDSDRVMLRHNDKFIKCIKVDSLSLMPPKR
jgi:hypothetical protein